MRKTGCPYTTRIQKGGALLEDMRVLVRQWTGEPLDQQRQRGIRENLLGKRSRARVEDTFKEVFVPRFVKGTPPEAWRILRPLEDRDLPAETVRPIYYWITARSDPLLYDFVTEEILPRRQRGESIVRTDQAALWIRARLAEYETSWSPAVTLKVARGLLAALRDFGILEGAANKRIAPAYLPVESFAYIALALHQGGPSGERLVQHPDWRLFLLVPHAVEQLLLEAHQRRLLSYHAAGKIVRIEFATGTLEKMADVIVARAR